MTSQPTAAINIQRILQLGQHLYQVICIGGRSREGREGEEGGRGGGNERGGREKEGVKEGESQLGRREGDRGRRYM